jgi:DNA-directed RNA polymerase specialized sigma24 family protein
MADSMHVVRAKYGSWEELYFDVYPLLLPSARRLSNGNRENAEDLLQNTFFRAFKTNPNPETIELPERYFRVTLWHTWTKKKGPIEVDLDQVEPNHPDLIKQPEIQHLLESEEMLQDLFIKGGPLTRAEKQLLKAYLCEFTFEEIAQALGEDVCRTKFRWSKLVSKLRYRLRPRETKAKS